MSGISITLDLQGGGADALRRAAAAGEDMSPAMRAIAVHLETTTKERFDAEAGPDGAKWQPSQRVLESGGKTLFLIGGLKDSIQSRWDRTTAMAGPEKSYGAAVYAAIHQFGGEIRPRAKKALSFGGRLVAKVTMPARPYVGFSPADREEIAALIGDHFRSAISGSEPAP